MDCTKEVELCRSHHITGFPSIRVFRKGSDDITVHGIHEHESYRGAVLPLAYFCSRAVANAAAPHCFFRHIKGRGVLEIPFRFRTAKDVSSRLFSVARTLAIALRRGSHQGGADRVRGSAGAVRWPAAPVHSRGHADRQDAGLQSVRHRLAHQSAIPVMSYCTICLARFRRPRVSKALTLT